jgi:hypothetical protein
MEQFKDAQLSVANGFLLHRGNKYWQKYEQSDRCVLREFLLI